MENPQDIIVKIKEYQNKTIHKLLDELSISRGLVSKYQLSVAGAGITQNLKGAEEKKEMERKLKFELISKDEYDFWQQRQEKIELMNCNS